MASKGKLSGNRGHIEPAQTNSPEEFRRVQRQVTDNLPPELKGRAVWKEDLLNQNKTGYRIIHTEGGATNEYHVEYIEAEDAWYQLNVTSGVPITRGMGRITTGDVTGLYQKGQTSTDPQVWRNPAQI